MAKYRVLTNDVGANRFSCFKLIEASSQEQADEQALLLTRNLPVTRPLKVVALPETMRDLMDGQTGMLKGAAKQLVIHA